MVFTTLDGTFVPNFAHYRRPNLVFLSGSGVTLETGLDGTSGDAVILFPDGNLRTETSSSRYQAGTGSNAVFTNATLGSNQGGLRTGTVTNNTWYAAYAVKVTTFAANWVMVLDTVLPLQANYSTLNTNFGTNSWVYLGLIRYGDNNGVGNSILHFVQSGNQTHFGVSQSGANYPNGTILGNTSSSTSSLTYTYTSGTGTTNIPNNIIIAKFTVWIITSLATMTNKSITTQTGSSNDLISIPYQTGSDIAAQLWENPVDGLIVPAGSTDSNYIFISGYVDGALGVGSNPLL